MMPQWQRCPLKHCVGCLQARVAAWKRRALQEEAERNDRAGGGYAGPDGSGQWVSIGELGWGGHLDAALGDLATGDVACCSRDTSSARGVTFVAITLV